MVGVLSYDTQALVAFARCCQQHADALMMPPEPTRLGEGGQATATAVAQLHTHAVDANQAMTERIRATSVAVQTAAYQSSQLEAQTAQALQLPEGQGCCGG